MESPVFSDTTGLHRLVSVDHSIIPVDPERATRPGSARSIGRTCSRSLVAHTQTTCSRVMVQTPAVSSDPLASSDFYTGIVAELYRHLRSETFDPEPYARFVERSGEPALELGCGDGDPLLDLRARGLAVEGLDSSLDMLERCTAAATERGLDVTLHHATFEEMRLGRQYRSIYLAGATFNLLPDDEAAQAALGRIATHLRADGSALIPLLSLSPRPTPTSARFASTSQATGS